MNKLAMVAFSGAVLVATNSALAEAPAQYAASCSVCHTSGVAGAPKTGDTEAWAKRLEGGIDAMVASARNGKGAMPPMGLCPTCSDDDFKALIEYMAK